MILYMQNPVAILSGASEDKKPLALFGNENIMLDKVQLVNLAFSSREDVGCLLRVEAMIIPWLFQ